MTFMMSLQSFVSVKIVHIFLDQMRPVKYIKNQKDSISSIKEGINPSGSIS